MEHCWVVVLGLILWLMPPCLDLTHELEPQQEWTYMVPHQCYWLCFKFGECGCHSKTPNCSTCHHTAGEACYQKTMGDLRTKALWWLGVNSVSEHETVWKKPSEVTPSPLLHHFDFHCVSCAMLRSSVLSNINQLFYMAFRFWKTSDSLEVQDSKDEAALSGIGSEHQRKKFYY